MGGAGGLARACEGKSQRGYLQQRKGGGGGKCVERQRLGEWWSCPTSPHPRRVLHGPRAQCQARQVYRRRVPGRAAGGCSRRAQVCEGSTAGAAGSQGRLPVTAQHVAALHVPTSGSPASCPEPHASTHLLGGVHPLPLGWRVVARRRAVVGARRQFGSRGLLRRCLLLLRACRLRSHKRHRQPKIFHLPHEAPFLLQAPLLLLQRTPARAHYQVSPRLAGDRR